MSDFPAVQGFFGLDLKTCCLLIATLGIVHPIAYVCTCFIPVSFIMVTIWILVAIYFAASIALFCGVLQGNPLILTIWVWYTMIFVCLMILLTIILVVWLAFRKKLFAVIITILSLLWYILMVYFIFVVNTHRKELGGQKNKNAGITYETTEPRFTEPYTRPNPPNPRG